MVLDRARREGLTEYLPYGVRSLTASIISILITAPMGAMLMASLGPRWLTKSESPKDSMIRGSMYYGEV